MKDNDDESLGNMLMLLLAMIALAVGMAALYASRENGDLLSSLEASFKSLSREIIG